MLRVIHSSQGSQLNKSAVKDPELDKLIDKMISTFDRNERLAVIKQAQVRIVDQAYWLWFPTGFLYYPLSARVKGEVKIDSQTVYYRTGMVLLDTWVE